MEDMSEVETEIYRKILQYYARFCNTTEANTTVILLKCLQGFKARFKILDDIFLSCTTVTSKLLA